MTGIKKEYYGLEWGLNFKINSAFSIKTLGTISEAKNTNNADVVYMNSTEGKYYGDANGDGQVDIADVQAIFNLSMGLNVDGTDPDAVAARDEIVEMYLHHADRANNWDLVDLSAPKILGHWLLLPTAIGADAAGMNEPVKTAVLDGLSDSGYLWRQRMSVVCTWKTTQQGDPRWCLRQAERHLHHQHDLMHKAVGWMLREVGKRVSVELLREFLRMHSREMPRTMLRYAIELMTPDERRHWMER